MNSINGSKVLEFFKFFNQLSFLLVRKRGKLKDVGDETLLINQQKENNNNHPGCLVPLIRVLPDRCRTHQRLSDRRLPAGSANTNGKQ